MPEKEPQHQKHEESYFGIVEAIYNYHLDEQAQSGMTTLSRVAHQVEEGQANYGH